MQTPIEKAVAFAGSQSELARRIGVSPQAVQQWVTDRVIPPKRVRAVAEAIEHQMSYAELNPDVFGPPPKQEAAA